METINQELYDYGTHYYMGDGIGFDYSLTKTPQVTDDGLLTMFMNGTFYDEEGILVDGDPFYHQHPVFEIGANGHQDLMFHMS